MLGMGVWILSELGLFFLLFVVVDKLPSEGKYLPPFHFIPSYWPPMASCLQVERDKDIISSRYSVINTPLSETNQWIQSTFLMLLEKSCSSVLLPTYVVFAGKRPGSRSLALSQLQKASP